MSLLRSILTLATAVSSVLVPISLGYALASHHALPVILAGVFLASATALAFASTRAGRAGVQADTHDH